MNQKSDNTASTPGQRSGAGYIQVALIVLVIAVALYFARAPDRVDRGVVSVSGAAAPVVRIFQPELTEHVQRIDLTGTVTLDRKLTVVSEVVGRVVRVSPDFVNGGTIPAGQVFVEIDPTEYEIEVQAAEMAVAEAEALVEAAGNGVGYGSQEALSVAGAKARLGQAEAALALARLRLARTGIKLPYTARVMSSELEVGDLVGPPEAVGRLSALGIVYRPDALQVRAPIKVADLIASAPAIGRTAKVSTVTGTYDAEVSRVSSVVAPETRLARVFLKFPENTPPESLPVPGMFAKVSIFGSRHDGVFVLPEAAARERDSIWIVVDGALRSLLKPVTVGRTEAGWIVEPFDPGDGVVVSALSGASEGLEVTVGPVPSS